MNEFELLDNFSTIPKLTITYLYLQKETNTDKDRGGLRSRNGSTTRPPRGKEIFLFW